MFSSNVLHGKGIKAFLDGKIIVSEFSENLIDGNTNLLYSSGARLEGLFIKGDYPVSSTHDVKYHREDGRYYEGRLENKVF
jgi:hypothetical protein